MRTVIINTLGAAYSRKDVYYMAFAPEQILWNDCELDRLHDCVQLIQRIHQQQTAKEDYQLIILLNADSFEGSEYVDHRKRVQKVLRAWIVEQLLRPLDELFLTPVCATEIVLSCKYADNKTSPVHSYCAMFHLDPNELPTTVELPYLDGDGTQHTMDLTVMLGQNVDLAQDDAPQTGAEPAPPASEPKPAAPNRNGRLDEFGEDDLEAEVRDNQIQRRNRSMEDMISQAIDRMQSFRLLREARKEMPIKSIPFQSQIQDPAVLNADLQINLARLIRSAGAGTMPDQKQIRVHTHKEMAQLLADADATLTELIDPTEPQPIYQELRGDLYSSDDAAEMELEIRTRLRKEAGDVPGVGEALEQWESPNGPEEELEPADSLTAQVRREIRSGILTLRRERKRFQERYAQLQKEYDREKVLEDQRKVFDICAGSYCKWRTEERRRRPPYDAAPTERRRPILDAEINKELLAARDRCAEGVLTQLNDYADVREEAAAIHTEFSSLTRLWSPNMHRLSTRYFYRFSLVMGIVFVVLMILPFFLISSQASDLRMARIVAFLINAGIFVLLYIVGFLIWLHKLAKEVRALRGELELLILKSAQQRRESVIQALDTYTRDLPGCLITQMNYNMMAEIDAKNAAANQKYEEHIYYLRNARKEISDVRTALRAQGYSVTGEPSKKTIDLLRPPYDPQNQGAYLLFSERGQ